MDLQEKVGYAVRKIGKNSKEGKFTTISEVAEDLDISEVDEDFAEFKAQVLENHSIKEIGDEDNKFLYSSDFMVQGCAKMLKDINDNNIKKLIADMVRKESKIYPRPTAANLFLGPPFNYSKETIKQTIKIMKEIEDYSDIQKFTGVDGEDYLYSTTFISIAYANALVKDMLIRMDDH